MNRHRIDLYTGAEMIAPMDEAEQTEMLAAYEQARPERERQAHNAPIQARIVELDAKRLRPSAEMALAFANGTPPDPTDVTRLNALTAEITALRVQLLP